MTGLKSGSGDDLWGDDEEDDAEEGQTNQSSDGTTDSGATASGDDRSQSQRESESAAETGTGTETHPYIVRRAIQDKSVQFERDERLTFFVHDDVVDGERDLLTELESALGRGVPKFDVREAVYRAALRNPDDVLDELLDMGYSLDEDRE